MTHNQDELKILSHIEKAARQSATLRQLREYDEAIRTKLEAIYEAEELQEYDLQNAKSEGKKAVTLQQLRYERMMKEQYYEIIVLVHKSEEVKKESGAIVYNHDIERYEKRYKEHEANVKELERKLTNA